MNDSGSVLALDLGATKLAARIITPTHQLERTFLLPFSKATEEMAAVITFLQSMKAEAEVQICGMACAPTLDNKGTVMRWPSRPHWAGLPLLQILADGIDCEIVFDDDGNAAALAESNAANLSTLVYIGLGTGVGGGIVLNGSILRAANQLCGEIGHMLVAHHGPRCQCGRSGCLQAYASATAILRNGFGAKSMKGHSLQALQEHYQTGSPTSVLALNTAARALAQVIVSISELLGVAVFCIGGSVGYYLPEIIDITKSRVEPLLRPGQPPIQIRAAVHGAMSSLAGAEIMARRTLRVTPQ
jgi:kanosamine 6-kinase